MLSARDLTIAVFLAAQIGIPLSYYLGDERYDERFAWRMFSSVRLARCDVRLFDATDGAQRPIPIARDLHVVWVNLLKRARLSVLDGYARKFCAEGASTRVLHADLTCRPPEAALRGICVVGLADRDRDGVPDGYRALPSCAGSDPAECFRDECGTQTAAQCHESRCVDRVVPRDADLCEGR